MGNKKTKTMDIDDENFLNYPKIRLENHGIRLNRVGKKTHIVIPGYDHEMSWTVEKHKRIHSWRKAMVGIGNIKRDLCHGCKGGLESVKDILINGLKPGDCGMFGSAIYLGPRSKAAEFVQGYEGYLLEVIVALGRELLACGSMNMLDRNIVEEYGFDSVRGKKGFTASWGSGTLINDEWAIYHPGRILVVGISKYVKKIKNIDASEVSLSNLSSPQYFSINFSNVAATSTVGLTTFGDSIGKEENDPRPVEKRKRRRRKIGGRTVARDLSLTCSCGRILQPGVDKLLKKDAYYSYSQAVSIICSHCGRDSGILAKPDVDTWTSVVAENRCVFKKKPKKKGRKRK